VHKSALIVFLVSLLAGLCIEGVDYLGDRILGLSKSYETSRMQLIFDSHNASEGCLDSVDDARDLILRDVEAMSSAIDRMKWYKIGVAVFSFLMVYAAAYLSVYLLNKYKPAL
jgi:hypothetical protein